jgi:hypothetical protein
MDRRLFLTGLVGAVGTTAIAGAVPRQAKALATIASPPTRTTVPQSDILPKLDVPELGFDDPPDNLDENIELAWHEGHRHRRRRRRVRRWRRFCRRYWHHGRWRRRCRRRPFWIWIFIG